MMVWWGGWVNLGLIGSWDYTPNPTVAVGGLLQRGWCATATRLVRNPCLHLERTGQRACPELCPAHHQYLQRRFVGRKVGSLMLGTWSFLDLYLGPPLMRGPDSRFTLVLGLSTRWGSWGGAVHRGILARGTTWRWTCVWRSDHVLHLGIHTHDAKCGQNPI